MTEQTVTITLSDGRSATFTGPVLITEQDQSDPNMRITSIKFSDLRKLQVLDGGRRTQIDREL